MRGEVVADQVHVQSVRHGLVDRCQEFPEADGAVLAVEFGDHAAVSELNAPNRLVVPCRA